MWNKDLKKMEHRFHGGIPVKNMCTMVHTDLNRKAAACRSVCTYKEPRPEPLWESVVVFVVGMAAMVALWLFLAVIASNAV